MDLKKLAFVLGMGLIASLGYGWGHGNGRRTMRDDAKLLCDTISTGQYMERATFKEYQAACELTVRVQAEAFEACKNILNADPRMAGLSQ